MTDDPSDPTPLGEFSARVAQSRCPACGRITMAARCPACGQVLRVAEPGRISRGDWRAVLRRLLRGEGK